MISYVWLMISQQASCKESCPCIVCPIEYYCLWLELVILIIVVLCVLSYRKGFLSCKVTCQLISSKNRQATSPKLSLGAHNQLSFLSTELID